jgi:hypothetical protein
MRTQAIAKYFENERRTQSERYLGANGQDINVANSVDTNNAGAAQPYIVTVTNSSTTTAVANVDVFGAYQYTGSSGFDSGGNLVVSTITIASGIGGVSYRELLAQSNMQPFVVNVTYIYSLAGAAGQVFTPFTVVARSANGNQASKAIIPMLNPLQYQAGVAIINQSYRIDGSTKLTFASIAASVQIQIQFFPTSDINVSRGLNGEAVARNYGAPQLG